VVTKYSPEVRAEHRQHLIDAAWRCVARTGYCDMTVDHVCREAGVTKGAFYWYFSSRDDVLLALLEEEAEATERAVLGVIRSTPPGLHRLRRFAKVMLEDGDDRARMQVRADLFAEMLCEKEVRRRYLAHMRRRHGLLRRAIEEGMTTGDYHEAVPARAVATILLALADGLMLHAAVDPRSLRWPTLRQGVDVLLAGLRTWGISPGAEDTA
jgi:AcrR family transcriptional regulator